MVDCCPASLYHHPAMKLSLFSDYALRIMMYAALKGEAFQLEEVSAAFDISKHHLAKIVQGLSKLGYLDTRRGRGGGIQLARPPEDIFIGKLVRETEANPAVVECFNAATNTCRLSGCCQLKAALAKAQKAFFDSLDAHTLLSLVNGPQRTRMVKILLPG